MKPSKFDLEGFGSLEATVGTINTIEEAKFSVFLQKIVDKYKSKEEISFGLEEEKKLIPVLGLKDGEELNSICNLLELIIQQAVYHIVSTSQFKAEVSRVGFSEGSVSALSEVWSQNRRDLIQRARETCSSERQLSTVDWSLNLVMAKSSLSTPSSVRPSAVLDLGITKGGNGKETEVLSMEFDHKRLYDFYRQLETIQQQLDSLTS